MSKLQDYLNEIGIKFDIYYNGHTKPWGNEYRGEYKFTISGNGKEYSDYFYDSIINSWILYKGPKKLNGHTKYHNSVFFKKCIENNTEGRSYELLTVRKAKNNIPKIEDVFSCLQWYSPESFNDFCDEYGYNNDSIKDKELWKKVLNQHLGLLNIFSENEREKIQEILQDY